MPQYIYTIYAPRVQLLGLTPTLFFFSGTGAAIRATTDNVCLRLFQLGLQALSGSVRSLGKNHSDVHPHAALRPVAAAVAGY